MAGPIPAARTRTSATTSCPLPCTLAELTRLGEDGSGTAQAGRAGKRLRRELGVELAKGAADHLLKEPEPILQLLQQAAPRLAARLAPALEGAGVPVAMVWALADGLRAIGEANAQGHALALRRNFISGFFSTLITALANPGLPLAKARHSAITYQAPWLRANERSALRDTRHKEIFLQNVQSYHNGARACEALLQRMQGSRAELLARIRVDYGPEGLIRLYRLAQAATASRVH